MTGARVPVAPVSSLRGSSTQQSLILDDIVPFDPRGRNIAELTLPELAVRAAERTGERLELAKRIGRSLLCLLAPLIALLALSFTTRANQAFVLPLACAGLMATEIAGTSVLAGVLSAGLVPVLALVIGGGIVIGAGLILAVALRSSAVARPGLGRS